MNFQNVPEEQNAEFPKPPVRPLTYYDRRDPSPITAPDEYLVTHQVVDVNVIRCFPSSGEFWTNHVRRTKLKVWFL